MSAAQDFGSFVSVHATKAGYDISGPRSGGRKSLAEDTGMSQTSVSRMLNGQVIPDAYALERLANAINVHVFVLLEAAGVVSPGALTTPTPPQPKPLTVRQAAEAFGITEPINIRLLEAVTAVLLDDKAGAA